MVIYFSNLIRRRGLTFPLRTGKKIRPDSDTLSVFTSMKIFGKVSSSLGTQVTVQAGQ